MNGVFNLGRSDALDVLRRWQASFIPPGEMKRLGVPKQFAWHVFSYNVVRATRGAQAVADYEAAAENADDFFVIASESSRIEAGRVRGPAPFFHGSDITISPPDFSWTMAFTHEEPELGPYFALRSL